ncbi:fluoride efflux transporter CrcB [uncultured Cardiobacterium sp.]|uniref:fluoride efflux transporter CrcB n=1 Tax=uncultured Cardiobacterium sp. TaxID=417619 RepID=UPI00263183D5|nr:fluoride efflux transporter CrcB [uncultured Cardiobacterium sp.]
MNFIHCVLLFLGGGLGSVARYLLGLALPARTFPLGTFCVNVLGCLFIGYLAATLARDNAALRALCISGFCGGFTTFSTFSLDIVQRWQAGHYLVPTLYLAASLICGIAAVLGGMALAR